MFVVCFAFGLVWFMFAYVRVVCLLVCYFSIVVRYAAVWFIGCCFGCVNSVVLFGSYSYFVDCFKFGFGMLVLQAIAAWVVWFVGLLF